LLKTADLSICVTLCHILNGKQEHSTPTPTRRWKTRTRRQEHSRTGRLADRKTGRQEDRTLANHVIPNLFKG